MRSIFLYIFRHGETDWNAAKRFQGHTDIPLNEKGRAQAKELAKIINKLNLEVILSSDLSRAKETAEIAMAGLNVPLLLSKNLREAYLGEPEGKYRDEIIRIYGEENWKKWLSGHPEDMDFAFPQGETKREHLKRILDFLLEHLKKNPQHKNLGVSAHGGTLKRLLHFCDGAPHDNIPTPNCCVYKVELKNSRWIYHGEVASVTHTEKLFT